MPSVISVEHLSKAFHIGQIGTGTFTNDLKLWWAKMRGKPNPLLQIDEADHGNRDDETIWALRDVSFTVEQGEVLGIIGHNGSGKSTLLKILSRVTAPTSGRIRVKGRVASLLEVGTGFHPELTGRENIYLNGTILGMSRKEIDRTFDEIVDFAEVEKFIDTPVKRYSSGMYLRLAFAVAAHLEPDILVVDEVLAVGDAEFQRKCLGKMGAVAKQGRTILFVSHNMASIRKLCHRGLLLSTGKISFHGEIDHTIDIYLTENQKSKVTEIELPKKAKNDCSTELGRGVSLSFYSYDRQKKSQFKLREPWKIFLEFEIYQPVGHAIAGVGLSTLDGIPLVTYWSHPKKLSPGSYKAEFDCNLPLQAGSLTITVGLSDFEKTFYYVENQGVITISDVAVGDQPLRTSGTGLLVSGDRTTIEYIGQSRNVEVSA